MKLSFKTILPILLICTLLILFAGCGTTPLLTYTVTFDKNGGDTEANPTTKTAIYGGNVGTLPTEPTRAGYTFASWNTEAGGSGTGFTETIAVTASIPVYAQWTAAPVVSVTDTWSVVDTDSLNGESANLGGGQQHFKWFAKNRINNTGFEMAIGTDDGAPAGQNTADTVWVSEQQELFTLSYDGSGNATLSVANHPSVSFTVGAGTFGRIGINAKARTSDGRTTSLSNLVFSLGSLSTDNVSVRNGMKSLTISGVDMSSAWTLTGNFKFTWDSIGSSEDQAIQFSID